MVSRNQKNFEFKLGKQGLLLLIGGISLLLFAVFVFGVMVGEHIDAYPERISQFVPEIIRRHLYHPPATAEKVAVAREEVKIPPPADESNVGGSATDDAAAKREFPQTLSGAEDKKTPPAPAIAGPEQKDKKTRDSAAKGPGTPEKAVVGMPPPVEKDQDRLAHPPTAIGVAPLAASPPVAKALGSSAPLADSKAVKPSGTAPQVGKGETSGTPAPSGAETAGPPPKAGTVFVVQAGSFQNLNKAKQFDKKITALGYTPHIELVNLPKKGNWFRVIIGGFASRDEAKKAAGIIAKKMKGVNCVVRPAKQ